MKPPEKDVRAIIDAVSSIRVPACPEEYDLHAAVDAALTTAGIAHQHEYRLGPRRRIDFLAGHIGIEIKKGRPSASALRSQAERYLESNELDAIVVVTQQYAPLPNTIAGKPVYVVALNRLWGVALP